MVRQYVTKERAVKRIQNHLINRPTSVDILLGICIGLARRASLFNVADNLEEIVVKLSEVNEELEKNLKRRKNDTNKQRQDAIKMEPSKGKYDYRKILG